MMNNQFYNQNPMYGYGYSAPRPQARNTQPLTPEQIQKLRQDSNAFDMKVEQEDLWRAACTHKEKNGASTLVQNNDGTYTCTICHETFPMCDCDENEINEAVNKIISMLQTSKTVYLDAPEELVRQYYQMIPLLKKFPTLWKRAIQNFSMYEGTMNGVNPMSPGYSGFTAMQNLLTNPYAGYNGYQPAPQYPQYQAPTMPMQQPYGYAPQMTMAPQMDPMNNPMAYGTPMQAPVAQAPVAPAPGVMPAAPAPAPAAAPAQTAPAAAPAGEVQQQQVFNV